MNRLLEKIPTFLQEYREYIKITETEIPEFDLLLECYRDLTNAQFIFKCPEKWFKTLYEEPLGLSGEGHTIEERRVAVYNLYNNGIPYNRTTVNNRVYAIIPKDKCDINISTHRVVVKISGEFFDKKDIVYTLLDTVIPLNMIIKIELKGNTWEDGYRKHTWESAHQYNWEEALKNENFKE